MVTSRIRRFPRVASLAVCQVGRGLKYTPSASKVGLRTTTARNFSRCWRVAIQSGKYDIVAFVTLCMRVVHSDAAILLVHALKLSCYLSKASRWVDVVAFNPCVSAFVLRP